MLSAGGGCSLAIITRSCTAWGKFKKLLTSKHISLTVVGRCLTPSALLLFMEVKLWPRRYRSRLATAPPKWQINDPMDLWRQATWWNLHWFVVCKAGNTGGRAHSDSYFFLLFIMPPRSYLGGILFLPCLFVCLFEDNFNIGHNFWAITDRDLIFGTHMHLLKPYILKGNLSR